MRLREVSLASHTYAVGKDIHVVYNESVGR
jgi:hypothetical protein